MTDEAGYIERNLVHITDKELQQLKTALDIETKRREHLPTEKQISELLANFKKSDAGKAIRKEYKDIKKEIASLTKRPHTIIINIPVKIKFEVTTDNDYWEDNWAGKNWEGDFLENIAVFLGNVDDIFSVSVTGAIASHAPNITAEQRVSAVTARIQTFYSEISKHKEIAPYLTLKDFD